MPANGAIAALRESPPLFHPVSVVPAWEENADMEQPILSATRNGQVEDGDMSANPDQQPRLADAGTVDWLDSAWLENWLRLARMNHSSNGN